MKNPRVIGALLIAFIFAINFVGSFFLEIPEEWKIYFLIFTGTATLGALVTAWKASKNNS